MDHPVKFHPGDMTDGCSTSVHICQWCFDSNIRMTAGRDGMRMLESDHQRRPGADWQFRARAPHPAPLLRLAVRTAPSPKAIIPHLKVKSCVIADGEAIIWDLTEGSCSGNIRPSWGIKGLRHGKTS